MDQFSYIDGFNEESAQGERYLYGSAPPAAIRSDTHGLYASDFQDATHVLVYATHRVSHVEAQTIFTIFGTTLSGRLFSDADRTLYYADVGQYLLVNSNAVLAVMSRHFNKLYDSIVYNDPMDLSQLFRNRIRSGRLNERKTIRQLDNLKKEKISAQHHYHFVPSEILLALEGEQEDVLDFAGRLPPDSTMSFAAGYLLWYATLDTESRRLARRLGFQEATSVQQYITAGKSLTIEAKSLQNLLGVDLRSFFELEVLVNRISGEVDWAGEKSNRTELRTANVDANHIYSRALDVFTGAKSNRRTPMKSSWKSYWDSRWQWSAIGSIHSQHQEDDEYVLRTSPNLKNKFVTIANMPDLDMSYFSDRQEEVHAWASTKYEWSKQRAIYGTDLTSYVMSHYSFYNCEELLPSQFPVGGDANEANVTNRVAGVLYKKLPFCLDFEDFNSQHSAESMGAVVQAYVDTFRDKLTPEQVEAAIWTGRSIANQTIHDNVGLKETYDAHGTLLSGWRLTTFMNSVLNYIYTTLIAADSYQSGSSLHNGDDVLVGTRSLRLPQACSKNARKYNIRLQNAKCAFGATAEFLRVDHKRGSKGQYLSRSVATMVHSRIESRPSTDAKDLVQAMESRFSDALDRGMSLAIISRLRAIYYRRQAQNCGVSENMMYEVKLTHRVLGGVSADCDALTNNKILTGRLNLKGVTIPRLAGVESYARKVRDALSLKVSYSNIADKLYDATYQAISEKDRTVEVVKNDDSWYLNVKRIYRAHRGSIKVANYGKAALVGHAYDFLQAGMPNSVLVSILNRSNRPLELLQNLV